jgi:hypothetical protein
MNSGRNLKFKKGIVMEEEAYNIAYAFENAKERKR